MQKKRSRRNDREKLKQEMDRIMQRNVEVQNENRSLKEEMAEMEHELVNAKVLHAQVRMTRVAVIEIRLTD